MTARTAVRLASVALALPLFVVGCTSFQEVTVETPLQAKLDVSQCQRVLVVGFIAGGSAPVAGVAPAPCPDAWGVDATCCAGI